MIKLKNKSAKMELAIIILVVATLVTYITAIAVFNFRMQNLEQKLYVSASLEDMYSRSDITDFTLKQIAAKVAANPGTNAAATFLNELRKYRGSSLYDNFYALYQAENQLSANPADCVKIDNGFLIINFKLEYAAVSWNPSNTQQQFKKASYERKFNYEVKVP